MKRDKEFQGLIILGMVVVSIPLGLVAQLLSDVWIWSLGISIPSILLILLSYWRTASRLGRY
jgi:hypothetical protein